MILVAQRRVLLVGKVEELRGSSNEGSLRLPVNSLVVCTHIYLVLGIPLLWAVCIFGSES